MKLVFAAVLVALVVAVSADDCQKCLDEVNFLKEHVSDDAYWNNLLGHVEHLCTDFPHHVDDCKAKIQTYAPQVRTLIKSAPAQTVCTIAHICQSGEVVESPRTSLMASLFAPSVEKDFCKSCIDGLTKAEHDAENPEWQKKLHHVVDEACDFVPDLATLCKTTTTALWSTLIDKFEHADAAKVCHAIGACSSSFSLDDAFYHLSNGNCELCTEYATDLKSVLPDAEAQIEKDLHDLCDMIGPEMKECNEAVSKQLPSWLKKIEGESAKEFCTEVHACQAETAGPMCEECKLAIKDVQVQLKTGDAKQRLEKIAKDACDLEPEFAADCMEGFEQFYQPTVDKILALDPATACAHAHAC